MQGTIKVNEAVESGMKRGFTATKSKTLVKYLEKGNGKVFQIELYWYKLRGSDYYIPAVSCRLLEHVGMCLRSLGLGFTDTVDNLCLKRARRINDLWKVLDKVDETALFAKYSLIKDTDILYSKENLTNNPVFEYRDGKVCKTILS